MCEKTTAAQAHIYRATVLLEHEPTKPMKYVKQQCVGPIENCYKPNNFLILHEIVDFT